MAALSAQRTLPQVARKSGNRAEPDADRSTQISVQSPNYLLDIGEDLLPIFGKRIRRVHPGQVPVPRAAQPQPVLLARPRCFCQPKQRIAVNI